MPAFNQWTGIGRLGKTPELAVTSNQAKPYAKFSLAVDQGQNQPTMWLQVTCWDKLAETVEKHARKGMLVFVQCKLQVRSYRDKQHGIDRLSVEIIATVVQLLERRKDEPTEPDIPDDVLPPE